MGCKPSTFLELEPGHINTIAKMMFIFPTDWTVSVRPDFNGLFWHHTSHKMTCLFMSSKGKVQLSGLVINTNVVDLVDWLRENTNILG